LTPEIKYVEMNNCNSTPFVIFVFWNIASTWKCPIAWWVHLVNSHAFLNKCFLFTFV